MITQKKQYFIKAQHTTNMHETMDSYVVQKPDEQCSVEQGEEWRENWK
jgi:hypothetical protein